jgi:outer membrane immunogenic protein
VGAVGPNGCTERTPGENFAAVDPDGFLGGLQAGYNVQAGQFVYGIEGDVSWADLKGDAVFRNFNTIHTANTKKDFLATLTGRLGVAFDRGLLYGKAGVAWVHDDHWITIPGTTFSKTGVTRTGWTVGAGYEYAFAAGWSAKIEYNFMDFGKHTSSITGVVGAGGTDPVTIDQNIHVVKIGLNYRFGGDPWGKAPVVAKY